MSHPSLEVADIFQRHGAAWRAAQAGHLGLGQLKVMAAIEACRTAALGGHVEACAECGQVRIAYNSCRNRHCPKCCASRQAVWLGMTAVYTHTRPETVREQIAAALSGRPAAAAVARRLERIQSP